MGASCPGLLHPGAYRLELAEAVRELPFAEEKSGTSDGEVVDPEVNPENRSVLGGGPFGLVFVPVKADMQEELAVAGGECAFRDAPFVRVEVLTQVAIIGVGYVFSPNSGIILWD